MPNRKYVFKKTYLNVKKCSIDDCERLYIEENNGGKEKINISISVANKKCKNKCNCTNPTTPSSTCTSDCKCNPCKCNPCRCSNACNTCECTNPAPPQPISEPINTCKSCKCTNPVTTPLTNTCGSCSKCASGCKCNPCKCDPCKCGTNTCKKCKYNPCKCETSVCSKCKCNPCKCVSCGCGTSTDCGCDIVKDECGCSLTNNICDNRDFRDNSAYLRCKLGKLQQGCGCIPQEINGDLDKYQNYRYNGSFHKTFKHDKTTGHLIDVKEYEKMIKAIRSNDANALGKIKINPKSQVLLTNPTASMATILVGIPQCQIDLRAPPTLSSHESAAEMVEMYSLMLARDVPFVDFETSTVIQDILGYMNKPNVLKYMPDYEPRNVAFTVQTLFRGISTTEQLGPYISQLLLLNVPMGSSILEQKYDALPTKLDAISNGINVEWGRNNVEMINIQNGELNLLPPYTPSSYIIKKHIYSGRVLAETVHKDPLYSLSYNASMILAGLGCKQNPGWTKYKNQEGFVTNSVGPNVQCALAEVAQLCLMHAWYFKWQLHLRLRPEVYSLWIDNIKNNRVANKDNYDISNVILKNPVLDDIEIENSFWGYPDSYTLSSCFREGSPAHPSFHGGHSTVSAGCATILKIYFADGKWGNLPGVKRATINNTIVPTYLPGSTVYVQSSDDGNSLINYTGNDRNEMTVYGEINKLASNIGIGRNWANVHYRTDGIESLKLGELVAIKYMEDKLSSMIENNSDNKHLKIKFTRFDGSVYTIEPTTCKTN